MIAFRLLCCTLLALVIGASALAAQEEKQAFLDWLITDGQLLDHVRPMHSELQMVNAFPRIEIDTTIDVTRYSIVWDAYSALQTEREKRPARKIEASVQMTVRSRVKDLSLIKLNSESLIIDSIVSQGNKLAFTTTSSLLRITPLTPLAQGDSVTFTVYYAITQDRNWLSVYSLEDVKQNAIPTGSFFTFAQPNGARTWLPCNDVPTDKALMSVRVRVPKEFTVVSNGVPTDSVPDGDTASWQSWAHDQPMPTYLLTINAAVYKYYPQEYRRKDGSVLPIRNYHYYDDHEGAQYNAVRALANAPKWFEALESRLGTYPFSTYGHVTVTPIQFGGMEHQTMSTINRVWLTGNYENGYVHEVAHHWIGDLVTCATWSDIWLNEGGASFCEALYYEYVDGQGGYRDRLNRFRTSYLRVGLTGNAVYDPPPASLFSGAITYAKAGWVYHMIRRNVNNDDAFFAAWQEYFNRYRLSSAQTWQFLEFLKEKFPSPAVDWDTFFDQWLVKAGHPVLDVSAVQIGATRYLVGVAQTQQAPNVPEAFTLSLRLRARKGAEQLDTLVLVDKTVQQFRWTIPFTPDTIIVDPDMDILAQMQSTVTSVNEEHSTPAWCSLVGRQPLSVGSDVVVSATDVARARLMLVDVSGRSVAEGTIVDGMGRISTTSLAIGRYLVIVDDGSRRVGLPLAIVNP